MGAHRTALRQVSCLTSCRRRQTTPLKVIRRQQRLASFIQDLVERFPYDVWMHLLFMRCLQAHAGVCPQNPRDDKLLDIAQSVKAKFLVLVAQLKKSGVSIPPMGVLNDSVVGKHDSGVSF